MYAEAFFAEGAEGARVQRCGGRGGACGSLMLEFVNNSLYAVSQVRYLKVEDKAKAVVAKF